MPNGQENQEQKNGEIEKEEGIEKEAQILQQKDLSSKKEPVQKESKITSFSWVEIAIYGLVVLFVFLSVFLYSQGNIAKKRDAERMQNVNLLKDALEKYFNDEGTYPRIDEWRCLEEDVREGGEFSQKVKDYVSQIPQDPLYNSQDQVFCYHYKTGDSGKEYRLYAVLEKEKEVYQVYSPNGKRIYTGILGETPWYDFSWKFRKKIKIGKEKIADNLENFPLLFYLKDENIKLRANPEGNDILLATSDGKKLEREIIKYSSSTGELWAFLKVPHLSSSTDFEFYIYYGSSGASETNSEEVFDENFFFLHHLDEDSLFTTTTATTTDSSRHKNPVLVVGGVKQGVEGKILKGAEFDGIDDFFNLGSRKIFYGMEGLTFELWVKPQGEEKTTIMEEGKEEEEEEEEEEVVKKEIKKTFGKEGKEYEYRGIFGWEETQSGAWQLVTSLNETSFSSGYYKIGSETPLKLNDWNFIAGVLAKDKMILFINGEETSKEVKFESKVEKGGGKFAEIGRYYKETSFSDEEIYKTYTFSGVLDEIKISNIARTPEWIKTSFENQKDPEGFFKVEEGEEFY